MRWRPYVLAMVFMTGMIGSALPVRSAVAPFRLPYAKGDRFMVVQGYDTFPTHIKKDAYALDFSGSGCDAYGKPVVAAAPGKVMFMSEDGYNGGYGTELIIDHGGGLVSRYAHMIPDSIETFFGASIVRGQVVGRIGDTGLVAGMACATHPGTHLHFSLNVVAPDGTFLPQDPEPLSGYMGITAGKWYLSDNGQDELALDSESTTLSCPSSTGIVLGASTSSVVVTSTPVLSTHIGGVSVIPDQDVVPVQTRAQNDVQVQEVVIGDPPPTTTIIFSQVDDTAMSWSSAYGRNWFELGNGYAGTMHSLTIEVAVNGREDVAPEIALQEFKDAGYKILVRQFDLSAGAPITDQAVSTTFGGLSIPLKPYFYYRLTTYQPVQGGSVMLAGTRNNASGTAMWDGFIYGSGRVEYTEPFFPFMIMEGMAATSTLMPPPLTAPTDLLSHFDEPGMSLSLSFGTSTDPDWPENPLHYEMNYSTSSVLSDSGWAAPDNIPVVFGDSYLIGVRASDDYNNKSQIVTTTWSFPAGFSSSTPSALSN